MVNHVQQPAHSTREGASNTKTHRWADRPSTGGVQRLASVTTEPGRHPRSDDALSPGSSRLGLVSPLLLRPLRGPHRRG